MSFGPGAARLAPHQAAYNEHPAGHHFEDLTTEAARHGLAIGFGDTASVGIGGITLGGGVGYLARKHGHTIDNLLAAELVTADGRTVRTVMPAPPLPFIPEQAHGRLVVMALICFAG